MAQSALRNCDICMAAPGTEYCLDCEQYFCNSCKTLHKRAKVSRNHKFEIGTNVDQEVKPKCMEHNYDFIFLCSNCDVSVCKICVSGKHAGHTMADINDYISNLRETAKNGIFSTRDLLTTNLQNMEHELNNFDSDVVSVIKAIKEDGSKIKAMVDKEVEQMITTVKDQAKREKEKVLNVISLTRSLREDAKGLEKRNENLHQKGEDASLIPKLKNLIDEMSRLQVIPLPVFPLIQFSAKPVKNNDVINLLGTFKLRETQTTQVQVPETSRRFVGRFMERFERLEILSDKMKRFNNVYIKNFGQEMQEEEMTNMFEPFGKLISVKPQQQGGVIQVQVQEPLTATMLADAPQQEQKQMLGERLFPLIQGMYPDLAGKITGMLLEIDNSELLHMLVSRESLEAKVREAVAVLQAHQAKDSATGEPKLE